MYRLLIVDDEEIEREGMAQLIPWESYGIQLAGTAWNGLEALKIIQEEKLDMVLTDIKMPGMDGIELIRRTKQICPDITFIVLSGYGEYEFTSQAMQEGIRHYILKPCDEEKIMKVMAQVKEEIQEKRMHEAEKEKYRSTMRRLLPRAKEQVLRNLLLGREQVKADYQLFLEEIGDMERGVLLLAVRSRMKVDYLGQFIIGNILGELLGESHLLLSTFIQNDVLFLLDPVCRDKVEYAVDRTKAEFARIKSMPFCAALSEEGRLACISELYQQVQELFRIGRAERQEFLHYGMFKDRKDEAELLVDYQCLAETEDFSELLFELYLAYLKMSLKGYSPQQMGKVFAWTVRILYGEDLGKDGEKESAHQELSDSGAAWNLLEETVLTIARRKGLEEGKGKEGKRIWQILFAVYRNMNNQEISIQYLAKNELFMSEDYLGRIFIKSQKKKFNAFLLERRIELAKRLIQYDSQARLSDVAGMVGYAPDGQYFSKMFKKVTGVSPSEYRDSINRKNDNRL